MHHRKGIERGRKREAQTKVGENGGRVLREQPMQEWKRRRRVREGIGGRGRLIQSSRSAAAAGVHASLLLM